MAPLSVRTLTCALSTALLLSASFAEGAFGQHAAPASGTAKPVRISFVPPPLEGTISLGIYDSGGKLVRVLHREADIDDLEAGSDALVTVWDGNDTNGVRLAGGKYHARGFVVGDLEIDGVGFFFNDWVIDDDSPRIRRITKIWHDGKQLVLAAEIAGAPAALLSCDKAGRISGTYEGVPPESDVRAGQLPEVSGLIASAPGRDASVWVIHRSAAGVPQMEVKQFSAARELMRRLAFKPEDPQPIAIAAARDSDQIFLLEENAAGQWLRALSLLGTAEGAGGAVSDWKVAFEKKITTHHDFSISEGKAVLGGTAQRSRK
jgi:hypothetical protein